jgi:hypothetical protein
MVARVVGRVALFLAVLLAWADRHEILQAQNAEDPSGQVATAPSAVKAKPLAQNTLKGLSYLIEQQDAGGGWGQGGGWRQNRQGGGRVEGAEVADPSDLGNTCIATLALIRAGNTPQQGPYARHVARAVALICQQVEKSDGDSLYVTDVRDTQLQSKIGQYVDTFLAGLVLAELKGKMPADGSDKRLLAALDKTVGKIEKNQKADGTFAGNTGWASVLSQGLCSKFINRAAQNNFAVKNEVLQRDFDQSVAQLDKKTGEFKPAASALAGGAAGISASSPALRVSREAGLGGAAVGRAVTAGGPSDAGVHLYYAATNASRINDLGNTSAAVEQRANMALASKTATREEKSKAKADLLRVADVKSAQQAAVRGIVRQLDDKNFVAGFGNNGGEEFLSYMNISEMLLAKGGPEWERWDNSITANLERVQNGDGSWSGQHCITGRTFCTATALLTLMADRAPVPLAAQIMDKK